MTEIGDFALSKDDLVVINPGPGEYVHVMEGQRHGYRNLTSGITYTVWEYDVLDDFPFADLAAPSVGGGK